MGTIERKGSENLAESSATVVGQSYLGQAPKQILQKEMTSKSWMSFFVYTGRAECWDISSQVLRPHR